METAVFPSARAMAALFDHQRKGPRKRLLEFLLSVPQEAFVKPVPEAGGKSLRDHLVHLIGADEFWISLIQNRDYRSFEPAAYSTVEQVLPLIDEVSDRIDHVFSDGDEEWFVREMTISHHGRTEKVIPAMVATHMLTHEFHHKGQIVMIARMLGYEPPDTDLL
jgi:uncharacterized damage-inducible protein DinB